MNRLLRFQDWSMRAKLAALLIAASLLPLALTAWFDLQSERRHRIQDMQGLLAARGEQLAREFDSIHSGFLHSTQRVAFQPAIADYCSAPPERRAAGRQRVHGIFATFPRSDADIRGMALIDRTGRIDIATDVPAVGLDLSSRVTVRTALQGNPVISDIYVSMTLGEELPTVGYLVPVKNANAEVLCVVALWVHAARFWRVQKAAHERAGPGSFSVLYDKLGIRVGHSIRQGNVFRPAGQLEPSVVETLVASQRFGPRTRDLLQSVLPFPEQFDRARATSPDEAAFRSFAQTTNVWAYGVASRLKTVPWTVFYMMPEAAMQDDLAALTRRKALLALAIIAVAAMVGVLFAATILRPVEALSKATMALSAGDQGARVPAGAADELGKLGESFNAMADKIQAQAIELHKSHDELRAHADELEVANKDLEAFGFSVSHDLRAPLHVVDGFSKVLATNYAGVLEGKAAHYVSRIRASVVLMEQLVEGLLRLSRLGRKPLDKQPVDVSGLLNEVLEQLRREGVCTNHHVTVQDDLGTVSADGVLLRQVFVNLLSNACKFAGKKADPRITVGCDMMDGEREWFVRDNGAGFDAAHAAMLFAPFQRLHDASDFEGLGVGLSIVQRIVNRHGGQIRAEGAVGQGACFRFTLGRVAVA